MAGEFGKLSMAQEEVICSFCSFFGFIPDFISHTHVFIYIYIYIDSPPHIKKI